MLSLTQVFRFSVPDLGDDARRMGRVQPLAGADGVEHASRSSNCRHQGAAGRAAGGKSARSWRPPPSQAYNACTPTAVLLSQRLIGTKVFVK